MKEKEDTESERNKKRSKHKQKKLLKDSRENFDFSNEESKRLKSAKQPQNVLQKKQKVLKTRKNQKEEEKMYEFQKLQFARKGHKSKTIGLEHLVNVDRTQKSRSQRLKHTYYEILKQYKEVAWSQRKRKLRKPSELARSLMRRLTLAKQWKIKTSPNMLIQSFWLDRSKQLYCVYRNIRSLTLGVGIYKNQGSEWILSTKIHSPFKTAGEILVKVISSKDGNKLLAVSNKQSFAVVQIKDKKFRRNRADWVVFKNNQNSDVCRVGAFGGDPDDMTDYNQEVLNEYRATGEVRSGLVGWDEEKDVIFIKQPKTGAVRAVRFQSERQMTQLKRYLTLKGQERNLVSNVPLSMLIPDLYSKYPKGGKSCLEVRNIEFLGKWDENFMVVLDDGVGTDRALMLDLKPVVYLYRQKKSQDEVKVETSEGNGGAEGGDGIGIAGARPDLPDGFGSWERAFRLDLVSALCDFGKERVRYQRISDNILIGPESERVFIGLYWTLSKDLRASFRKLQDKMADLITTQKVGVEESVFEIIRRPMTAMSQIRSSELFVDIVILGLIKREDMRRDDAISISGASAVGLVILNVVKMSIQHPDISKISAFNNASFCINCSSDERFLYAVYTGCSKYIFYSRFPQNSSTTNSNSEKLKKPNRANREGYGYSISHVAGKNLQEETLEQLKIFYQKLKPFLQNSHKKRLKSLLSLEQHKNKTEKLQLKAFSKEVKFFEKSFNRLYKAIEDYPSERKIAGLEDGITDKGLGFFGHDELGDDNEILYYNLEDGFRVQEYLRSLSPSLEGFSDYQETDMHQKTIIDENFFQDPKITEISQNLLKSSKNGPLMISHRLLNTPSIESSSETDSEISTEKPKKLTYFQKLRAKNGLKFLLTCIADYQEYTFTLKIASIDHPKQAPIEVRLIVDSSRTYKGLYGNDFLSLKIKPELLKTEEGLQKGLVKFHVTNDLKSIFVTGFSAVKYKDPNFAKINTQKSKKIRPLLASNMPRMSIFGALRPSHTEMIDQVLEEIQETEAEDEGERSNFSALYVFKNQVNLEDYNKNTRKSRTKRGTRSFSNTQSGRRFKNLENDQNLSSIKNLLDFGSEKPKLFFYRGDFKNVKFATEYSPKSIFLVGDKSSGGYFLYSTNKIKATAQRQLVRSLTHSPARGRFLRESSEYGQCVDLQFFKQGSKIHPSLISKNIVDEACGVEMDPKGSFLLIKYLSAAKNSSFVNMVVEVWQRNEESLIPFRLPRKLLLDSQTLFKKVQVIREVQDISKIGKSNFFMCKQTKDILIDNKLFKPITSDSDGSIRYTVVQKNENFRFFDHFEISEDFRFAFIIRRAPHHPSLHNLSEKSSEPLASLNEYSIWRANEDHSLTLLEVISTCSEPYGAWWDLNSIFYMNEDLEPVFVELRRPRDYRVGFSSQYLNNLIKSLKMEEGDTDQIRRFNITNIDSFIKEELPEDLLHRLSWPRNHKEGKKHFLTEIEKIESAIPLLSNQDVNQGSSNLQMVRKAHEEYNLLYILAGSKNSILLQKALEKYGYREFFYKEGFDPIQAALEVNHYQSLEVIAKFLSGKFDSQKSPKSDENQIKSPKSSRTGLNLPKEHIISGFYNHIPFCKAMKTSHPNLLSILMSSLFINCRDNQVTHNASDTDSGVQQFPLETENSIFFLNSKSPILDVFCQKRIVSLIDNAVLKKETLRPVKSMISRIAFSSNLYRSSCRNLIGLAEKLGDTHLKSDFRYIILYIWEKNKRFWVSFFLCFEFFSFVTYNMFVLSYRQSASVYSLTVCLSFLESIFEIMGALKEKGYLLQWENYIDLLVYPGMFVTAGMVYENPKEISNPFFNFLVSMLILLSGLRALTFLSLFNETRYLISMILTVFQDIIGFAGISIIFLLIFSLGSINMFPEDSDSHSGFRGLNFEGLNDLRREMNSYYNYLFGNWEDLLTTNKFNDYQFTFYIVSSMFLAFILANLVIAMISKTFDDFQEDRELIDTKLMIKLLKEHGNLLSYFEWKKGKVISDADRAGMRHLVVIKGLGEDEEDEISDRIDGLGEEIGEKLNSIFEKIEGVEQDGKETKEGLMRLERHLLSLRKLLTPRVETRNFGGDPTVLKERVAERRRGGGAMRGQSSSSMGNLPPENIFSPILTQSLIPSERPSTDQKAKMPKKKMPRIASFDF